MASTIKSSHCVAIGSISSRHATPSSPSWRFLIAKAVLQRNRCAVVQRMRQRRGSVNPLQPEFGQRERGKKRRPRAHGVYRRPEVVVEPGLRQLHGARATAGDRLGFEYLNRKTCARHHHSRGKAIGTRSDDADSLHARPRVVFGHCPCGSSACTSAQSPFAHARLHIVDEINHHNQVDTSRVAADPGCTTQQSRKIPRAKTRRSGPGSQIPPMPAPAPDRCPQLDPAMRRQRWRR